MIQEVHNHWKIRDPPMRLPDEKFGYATIDFKSEHGRRIIENFLLLPGFNANPDDRHCRVSDLCLTQNVQGSILPEMTQYITISREIFKLSRRSLQELHDVLVVGISSISILSRRITHKKRKRLTGLF